MTKYIEVSGTTIAEAIQKGLNELDVSIEDVTTDIITQPKAGFFGFGKTNAKVRITVKEVEQTSIVQEIFNPKPVEAKKEVKTERKPVKTPKPQREENREQKAPVREPKVAKQPKAIKEDTNENELKAKEFVDGLLVQMNIRATANINESTDKNIHLEIVGEGLGNVIGRRGDTLDAIQYIATLALKNGNDIEKTKVLIDCQNYREKRRETLEKLALKMGHKVTKSKRNMTLEPMNPYERRIIHEVLQNFRGVHTYSTGKEPNRRVVVGFGEGKDKQ